ncbi:MAG TPA: HAMP domain-containing sensor histidine kinase [bacterium]|nr:HAMP domain-containing sensor histidine kinase [bacterium]HOL46700.1 HAMP domain-containing sensor histidine kinase [bacterium]HPQ18388.1 HAMP domain-containing sensor histidine kinase [bacterium]
MDLTEKEIKKIIEESKIKDYIIFNLLNISESVSTVRTLNNLIKVIEYSCIGLIKPSIFLIYNIDKEGKYFTPINTAKLKKFPELNFDIQNKPALNQFFLTNRKFFYHISELEKLNIFDIELLNNFKKLELEYFVPIILKDKLESFFIFTKKRDGKYYIEKEFEAISTIGQQYITIKENIKLIEETMEINRLLENANIELKKNLAERKILFEKLESAYNELKRIDQLKDDFIVLISHELNTPVTIIKSYIESLCMNIVEDDETKREFYYIIDNEVNRLINFIKKIIEITKLEADKITFYFLPNNIHSIINDVLNNYQKSIKEKQINIKIEFDEINVKEVNFDENYIYKVISAIIDNAIKFNKQNGEIIIKTKFNDEHLLVSIQDTGKGIAREDYSKIFSKFEQVESMMHHSEGLGLSLAIAKLIIEKAHKGKIWFESELNKGSTFYFSIPYNLVSKIEEK